MEQLDQKLPGSSTFVENLSNVKKAGRRSSSTPRSRRRWARRSSSVLLGKAQPADALDQAAQATNDALSGG